MNCFQIHMRLPGLNELIESNRRGWHNGARLKSDTDTAICWSIRKAMQDGTCRKAAGPVRIHFTWHERNRKRDLDNIFSGKKFILDAMQRMDILEGDGQKYVTGLQDDFVLDNADYVEVEITESG